MPQETTPTTQELASDTVLESVRRPHGKNVGNTERAITGAAGGALALWGLRRGGLLGMLSMLTGAGLAARAASGYCPAYARLEPTDAERALAERHGWKSAMIAEQSVTIARPREEIYRFWRDFANLPRFMPHIEHLVILSNERSHWEARAPMGTSVEWDSVITEDRPNERIAWESTGEADVRNAGWVEFRDAAAGGATEVRAFIAYEPPAGRLGRLIVKLWGEEPNAQAREDLQRLKQILETGQVAATIPPRPVEEQRSPLRS
jgi:uncharacterized membrane protein